MIKTKLVVPSKIKENCNSRRRRPLPAVRRADALTNVKLKTSTNWNATWPQAATAEDKALALITTSSMLISGIGA